MPEHEKGANAYLQDKTRGREFDLAWRRSRVAHYRKSGWTYADLVEEIRKEAKAEGRNLPKSWGIALAHHDATETLDDYNRLTLADTAEYRQLQMFRYEELLKSLWPQVEVLDYKAIDRILTIMAAINRMLGLNEPERFEIKARGTGEAKVVRTEVRITQDKDGNIIDINQHGLSKDLPDIEDLDVVEGEFTDG